MTNTSNDWVTSTKRRYVDAYSVAHGLVGNGDSTKGVGLVAGIMVGLLGVVSGSFLGATGLIMGVICGLVVGGSFYLLGILIAAAGQLLLASLDTAINTSPLLSLEEKEDIVLSLMPPRARVASQPPRAGLSIEPCPECRLKAGQHAASCSRG